MSMDSRAIFPLVFSLVVVGCEEKEKPAAEVSSHKDAGVSKAEALDPDIAQAVAAAASAGPKGASLAQGGPPPNGIFAPGGADKEIARGQPPKLTLGSDGSEPKFTLTPAQPKPGTKQIGTIQVVQQSQGGGLPVEFSVTLEAQKPKEAGATAVTVMAKVTGARVAITGAPRELEEQVKKLRGSKIEYQVAPDGAGSGFRYEAPKGLPPELEDIVRALSDGLAMVTLPYPDKPVGAGGFWMATSRDGVMGLDLVTYRMVKVESAAADKVSLSVNTKRYSASPTFDLPGLPPDAPRSLAEFQSMGEGQLELQPGRGFPSGGSQNAVLGASLQSPSNPAQRGMLEVRTRIELKLAPNKT
jgi:hypothetical protein